LAGTLAPPRNKVLRLVFDTAALRVVPRRRFGQPASRAQNLGHSHLNRVSSPLFMEQPSAPAPSENSLIEQRREKLAKLRSKGIDPFKNKFTPDSKCDEARSKFDKGE